MVNGDQNSERGQFDESITNPEKRPSAVAVGPAAFGRLCGTETVVSSSQQIITDDEDGRSTIVDVKIQKYEKLAKVFPKSLAIKSVWLVTTGKREITKVPLARLQKHARSIVTIPVTITWLHRSTRVWAVTPTAEKSYLALIAATGEQKFSGPIFELAQLYVDMDRLDLARKYLDLCLQIDPTFGEPHYWIAGIYLKQGRRELAIQSFERYLRVGNSSRQEEVLQTLQALQPDLRIHDIR